LAPKIHNNNFLSFSDVKLINDFISNLAYVRSSFSFNNHLTTVNVIFDRNDFGSKVIITNSEVFGDIIIHYNIPSGISYEIGYLNSKKSD
jgi:hypothetical protein